MKVTNVKDYLATHGDFCLENAKRRYSEDCARADREGGDPTSGADKYLQHYGPMSKEEFVNVLASEVDELEWLAAILGC
jgi:hypothetical protein